VWSILCLVCEAWILFHNVLPRNALFLLCSPILLDIKNRVPLVQKKRKMAPSGWEGMLHGHHKKEVIRIERESVIPVLKPHLIMTLANLISMFFLLKHFLYYHFNCLIHVFFYTLFFLFVFSFQCFKYLLFYQQSFFLIYFLFIDTSTADGNVLVDVEVLIGYLIFYIFLIIFSRCDKF